MLRNCLCAGSFTHQRSSIGSTSEYRHARAFATRNAGKRRKKAAFMPSRDGQVKRFSCAAHMTRPTAGSVVSIAHHDITKGSFDICRYFICNGSCPRRLCGLFLKSIWRASCSRIKLMFTSLRETNNRTILAFRHPERSAKVWQTATTDPQPFARWPGASLPRTYMVAEQVQSPLIFFMVVAANLRRARNRASKSIALQGRACSAAAGRCSRSNRDRGWCTVYLPATASCA